MNDLTELIQTCLRSVPPLDHVKGRTPIGDGVAGDPPPPPRQGYTLAAVLVPLVIRPQGPTVLLTERSQHLPTHPGQISFPGGHVDDGDNSFTATALRETEEETGLKPNYIDIVGSLDECRTGTGYRIIPIVGVVRAGFALVPDSYEVADIFEVPLSHLIDPDNHQRRARKFNGVLRHYYAIEYETRNIWGATAAMLVNLSNRLDSHSRLSELLN